MLSHLHVPSVSRVQKLFVCFFRVDDDDEVVDAEDHNLTIR